MLGVTHINDKLKKNSRDLKNKHKTYKAKQKQKRPWKLQ